MTTTTRSEHLEWCINRAMEYINRDQISEAYSSIISDLHKHPETISAFGTQILLMIMIGGDLNKNELLNFINKFE